MSPPSGLDPEVWIVLSTYCAGAHLEPQVDSIRAQSYSNWRLLVRDDGSGDGTVRRLANYAASDSRISIDPAEPDRRLGARASYSELISSALARGAQWIALADQDDVWMPRKLERQVQQLGEHLSRPDEPRLVHTDLHVVDEDLEPIAESFLTYSGLRSVGRDPLRTLLIQNFVTGCTCLFSRGLAERALPIPADAIMHDWWLALNAAAWGQIDFLPAQTAHYRQHPRNQIGAEGYGHSIATLIGRSVSRRRSGADEFARVVEQARAFEHHLRRTLAREPNTPESAAALALTEAFVALFSDSVSGFQRVRGLMRLGIARQDLIRDATLKLKLLTSSFPTAGA